MGSANEGREIREGDIQVASGVDPFDGHAVGLCDADDTRFDSQHRHWYRTEEH
jgi:hypothetical protein